MSNMKHRSQCSHRECKKRQSNWRFQHRMSHAGCSIQQGIEPDDSLLCLLEISLSFFHLIVDGRVTRDSDHVLEIVARDPLAQHERLPEDSFAPARRSGNKNVFGGITHSGRALLAPVVKLLEAKVGVEGRVLSGACCKAVEESDCFRGCAHWTRCCSLL